MEKIIPKKICEGDEIRIIAPSRSMNVLKKDIIELATERLEKEGFKITFGRNVMKYKSDNFRCASIKERIEDLHDAFRDENVKAILTAIGGYNVNQILEYIDYDLIKNNPKIICGFSDNTALINAIYAKTGMITYSGPQFFSFGMKYGLEYTIEYFKKILMQKETVNIFASKEWSNDKWMKDQEQRRFISNNGMTIIKEGNAKGTIIGGNLCTLNLLQGTEYMPDLNDSILFIEDDDLVGSAFQKEFDRNLQSLLHCAKNNKINGIIIGRSENSSEMNEEKWREIIESKESLSNIPIIINADFGHTTPIFTFPIGGNAEIEAINNKVKLSIRE